MKILSLVLSLLLCFNLMAAPPLGVSGQGDSSNQYPPVIKTPGNQVTKIVGGVLLETGNGNLLTNPSFEGSVFTQGWTVTTTGSVGLSTNSGANTTLELGKKHLTFTCDGTGGAGVCRIYQDVNTSNNLQAMAYAYISSDTPSAVKFMTRVNGAKDLEFTTTSASRSLYKIPFILGTTSSGVEIEITVGAGQIVTGTIDAAYLGAQDVKQDAVRVESQSIVLTSTSPITTTTDLDALTKSFPVGSGLFELGTFGIRLLKDANIDVSHTSYLSGSVNHLGSFIYVNGSTVASASNQRTSGSGNGDNASAALSLKKGDLITFGAGSVANFSAITILATTADNTEIFSSSQDNSGRVSEVIFTSNTHAPKGFISAMNKSIGKSSGDYQGPAYKALYDVLWSQAGLSTTAGDVYVISSAKGASAQADWDAGKTITIDYATNSPFIRAAGTGKTLGTYEADALQGHGHSAYYGVSGTAGKTAAVSSGSHNKDLTNSYPGMVINGMVSDITGAYGSVRADSETRSKNVALNAWIRYEALDVIVGSFKEVVTTPGVSKPSMCSAKISSTGAISSHYGGCFASCTNATTPVCTFTSNYWSGTPSCWHAADDTGASQLGQSQESSTFFYGVVRNSSGTEISGARRYFCHGETP